MSNKEGENRRPTIKFIKKKKFKELEAHKLEFKTDILPYWHERFIRHAFTNKKCPYGRKNN